jgi:hypothetical protein
MYEFFISVGTVFIVCSPAALMIILCAYPGSQLQGSSEPPHGNKREQDRREYETMLRHRRRAKLEKQLRKSQVICSDTGS